MRVTVEYAAQVKRAAGVASESVEVHPPCTLQDLALRLAENHGDSFRNLLFDSEGELHGSILFFVGENQVRPEQPLELNDSDVVTLLSPISGG